MKGYYGPLILGSRRPLDVGHRTDGVLHVTDGEVVPLPAVIVRVATAEEFCVSMRERGRPISAKLRRAMKGAYFYEVATD